ncbi:MAG: PASTA domain-containing protein [Kibdelosporangium sp.]
MSGVVLLGMNEGHPAQDVRLLSGAAWLASGRVGQVSLLDGSSAEVSAQVQVAPAGSVVDVVQAGTHAYAVDQSARTIRRIDGATFQVSPPEAPLGDAQSMTAFAGSGKLYVVDTRRGLIVNADPATGRALSRPTNFVAQIAPNTTGIDSDGRLWVADNTSGALFTVENGETARQMPGVTRSGRSILTMSGGKPVVVDPESREVLIIDPAARQVRTRIALDLRPGEDIQVSGSVHGDRTYVVGSRGVLTICELAKQSCSNAVGLRGGKLGAAVEAHDRLFVPDYGTGQVWIVDLGKQTVIAQPQVLKTGKEFQLLTRDGVVFFNDRDSAQAGVIHLDGGVENIAKYDEANPAKGLNTPISGVPQPAPPTPAEPPPPAQNPLPPNQPVPPVVPNPPVHPQQPGPRQPEPPRDPQEPQRPQEPERPQPPEEPGDPQQPTPPEKPVIHITMSRGSPVQNEDVTLKANDAKGVAPTEATWSFGDTKTGTGAMVGHKWADVGTYQVSVQVKMPDGQSATASRTVEVTKAPDTTVPSVVGQTEAAATAAITAAKLRVAVTKVASNTVAAGLVISQTPAGGALAPPQSTVRLTVSTGKRAAIDLLARAPGATWRSGAGALSYNGNDGDERGFALTRSGLALEDGSGGTYLETHPQWVANGYIEGTFTLPAPIIAGDRFRAKIGFIAVANPPSAGDATFIVSVIKNGVATTVSTTRDTGRDGNMPVLSIDLTPHAGATGIRLRVNAGADAAQDWASWIAPRIEG